MPGCLACRSPAGSASTLLTLLTASIGTASRYAATPSKATSARRRIHRPCGHGGTITRRQPPSVVSASRWQPGCRLTHYRVAGSPFSGQRQRQSPSRSSRLARQPATDPHRGHRARGRRGCRHDKESNMSDRSRPRGARDHPIPSAGRRRSATTEPATELAVSLRIPYRRRLVVAPPVCRRLPSPARQLRPDSTTRGCFARAPSRLDRSCGPRSRGGCRR